MAPQSTPTAAAASDLDVKQLVLSNTSFGPHEVDQLADAISRDLSKYSQLREAVAELEHREERSPATSVRLGVCYYTLGRYEGAITTLKNADGGALAFYYLGRAQFALERYGDAMASYESAAKAGYDKDVCAVARAEALRHLNRAEEALKVLDDLSGAIEQTADYLYQRGATVALLGGSPDEVIRLYERAVDIDAHHPGALFGLALENDRRGNDATAIQLYERSAARFPARVGALLNLGILYEDREQYERAQHCYERILDTYPNHGRANLFFKDTQASRDMYYDEEAQKKRDRLSQVLSIPVTDFELSVRSRNCLQKMGITTLGDLTRVTEQQLLGSKNFGETSLVEIREMLGSKGLELGQFADQPLEPEPAFEASFMSPDEIALLERPISELNLSVRARKCMIRLGIATVGELLRKTGDDLLECKNFGVTSLNEVREKLSTHGLKLRGD
jgi:DNA-directed RNA polymerase subunit alpha